MTRLVYREANGRFSTKDKADKIQEVENGKWKEPKPIEKTYEEHEYFIGADYDVKRGKDRKGGTHPVHVEFKITSPHTLSQQQIGEILNDKLENFSDKAKNLSHELDLEIKSENSRIVSHQTTLKTTSLIFKRKE